MSERLTPDEYQAAYMAALRAAGHKPVLNSDSEVDYFVTNPNGHNGPGCRICGWTQCMYCGKPEKIPACPGPDEDSKTRAQVVAKGIEEASERDYGLAFSWARDKSEKLIAEEFAALRIELTRDQ
jgi:hypothetical protein